MGKTLRNIGRGLGAGLVTLGKGINREEEIERQEQARREEMDLKQRDLQIREQDAKQRQEMNRLKLLQERVIFNNKQLMQAYSSAKGDPVALGQALSNYGSRKLQYEYDPIASKAAGDGAIVYRTGYLKKNSQGGIQMKDGRPDVDWLPLDSGKAEFKNMDELNNHIIMSSNPEFMLAQEMDERKEEKGLERAKNLMIWKFANDPQFKKHNMETEEGQQFFEANKTKIEAMKQDVKKAEAVTEKVKEETRQLKLGLGKKTPASQVPVAKYASKLKGAEVNMTDAEKQIAIADQKQYVSKGFEGITVRQAARMSELSENDLAQKALAHELEQWKKGEMTAARFRQNADALGVPVKLMNDMMEQASELEELEETEAKEAAGGGFFSQAIEWIKFATNPVGSASTVVVDKLRKKE